VFTATAIITATLTMRPAWAAGADVVRVRSFGYVEAPTPGFMLGAWVELGADALVSEGRIGDDLAAALKAEARRRVASGEYFAHTCARW
jgi:hypothetical protein